MNTGSNMLQSGMRKLQRLHQGLGASPIILFVLGFGSLFFWLCSTLVQVQTSQFLALGYRVAVNNISLSLLQQPWILITGNAPTGVAVGWIYGWVVELFTLIFGMALGVAKSRLAVVNHHLVPYFTIAGLVLIGLNGYADYNSSPGDNMLVKVLIALAIGMIVVVGLPLGIGFIEEAFDQL